VNSDFFIIYKGAGLRGDIIGDSEGAYIELPDDKGKLTVLTESSLGKGSAGPVVDARVPFSSSPVSYGLIDVVYPEVRPSYAQDLSEVQGLVTAFILNKQVDAAIQSVDVARYNILLARGHGCTVHKLLYIDPPVERGQAVHIDFPPLSLILQSGGKMFGVDSYIHTTVAINVLSSKDLSLLLECIASTSAYTSASTPTLSVPHDQSVDHVMQDASHPHDGGLSSNDKIAMLLRAYWLTRQCIMADPSLKAPDAIPSTRKLLLTQIDKSNTDAATAPSAIDESVKEVVIALLQHDDVCSSISRAGWCQLSIDFFDSLMSTFASAFASSELTSSEMQDMFSKACKDAFAQELTFDNCVMRDNKGAASECEKTVVACRLPGQPEISFGLVEVEQAKSWQLPLSRLWYDGQRSLIAKCLFTYFAVLVESADIDFTITLSTVNGAERDSRVKKLVRDTFGSSKLTLITEPSKLQPSTYKPHSYQFFLGLVWPALRRMQWKLIVDSDPSGVVFVSPGNKKQLEKRLREIKQERDQKRAFLTQETAHFGYGDMTKLTKRLFINASMEIDVVATDSNDRKISVEYILQKFTHFLLRGDDGKKGDYQLVVQKIIRELKMLLTTMIDVLTSESSTYDSDNLLDEVGFNVLLQAMLALPHLLQQSDIPAEQVEDALVVARELLSFASYNYMSFLDASKQPPVENYVAPERTKGLTLKSKLRVASGLVSPDSDQNKLTEAILEEDKQGLTDFIVVVLEQIIPCIANEDDARRKHRRVSLGYPGLTCRHCQGSNGEGRYFFSSVESVTTATTVFEKHLAKCSDVPLEVKERIIRARSVHAEQRKRLIPGAQQAFFSRLWTRMRSMSIKPLPSAGDSPKDEAEENNKPPAQPVEPAPTSDDESPQESGQIEFTNHLNVLDHICAEEPWKDDQYIQEMMNQYYTCIEQGGRIYNTASEPLFFSSEWVLAKYAPKREKYKKPIIPG
jgi:hypothetical protein